VSVEAGASITQRVLRTLEPVVIFSLILFVTTMFIAWIIAQHVKRFKHKMKHIKP